MATRTSRRTRRPDAFEARIISLQGAMRNLHNGSTLLSAAESLLDQLPPGNLQLVTTSYEGMALVAVCAALAAGRDVTWELVDLGRPPRPVQGPSIVVAIEPVEPPPGWLAAIRQVFPTAHLAIPGATS